MQWYYAGLDAKPVGPISSEELQARRLSGAVTPETYVIEYVGQPGDALAWKRYREVFPSIAIPSPVRALPPPPPVAPPVPTQPHPLFPSASVTPKVPVRPLPSAGHLPGFHARTTNPWCTWGFGLGLASLFLLLPSCGLTAFLAILAAGISIVGILQVQHDPAQSGRGLAFGGLALSAATILIIVIVLIIAVPSILKGRALITTTEQSTNDSD